MSGVGGIGSLGVAQVRIDLQGVAAEDAGEGLLVQAEGGDGAGVAGDAGPVGDEDELAGQALEVVPLCPMTQSAPNTVGHSAVVCSTVPSWIDVRALTEIEP